MRIREAAVVFSCLGEQLVGVLAHPEEGEPASDIGVIVVVGGPQYRVGSHRQFLLLSRKIASAGYPVFRFDYRGMGDSDGAQTGCDAVSDDIGAAIDAFIAARPSRESSFGGCAMRRRRPCSISMQAKTPELPAWCS